jgi:hypothetical protein
MAISFIASGAAVSGAGGLTVAVPAHQAGDLIVILVGAKPNTMTPNTPAGFTLPTDGTGAGGAGTTGVDTGPMKAFVFYNVDEDNSIASVALSSAGGLNVWSAIALVYRSGSGSFDLAAANGVDSTTGTPFQATMGTDPGLAAGDMVAVVGAIPTDVSTPAQFSAETLAATGITTTLDAEVVEFDTQTGNDMGGVVCRFTVNSGTSSAAPTFSATAGGTTTNVAGPIVLLRIRQAAGGAAHSRTPADGIAFTDAWAEAVAKRLSDGLGLTDAVPVSLNGDFETDLSGWVQDAWVATTFTRESGWSSSGSWSARLAFNDATPGRSSGWRTPTGLSGIPIVGGSLIRMTVDVNVVTPANGAFARFYWYDASGANLGSVISPLRTTDGTIVFEDTAPANAAYVSVSFGGQSNGAFDAYFDDVRVVRVSPAVTRVVTWHRTLGDALALTDARARTVAWRRTRADSVAFTDQCSPVKAGGGQHWTRTPADSFALADARTRVVGIKRTRADTFGLTDAEREVRGKRIADGLALADTRSRTLAYARGRADSLSLTDQATPVKMAPSAFVREIVVVL